MGLKASILQRIEALTFSFWRDAKFTWNRPLLPQYYEEIQQLRLDLEMVIGIEKAAFMYAMIDVNGSTEHLAEIHWENYLARSAPIKARSLCDAVRYIEQRTGSKVIDSSLEDGVFTARLSGIVHPVAVTVSFSSEEGES